MRRFAWAVLLAALLAGCADERGQTNVSKRSASELAMIQSRAYDGTTGDQVFRAVIATFLDLGFSIDQVDSATMTVSASKAETLSVTAIVEPMPGRTLVRCNAVLERDQKTIQIDSPEFYRADFFNPLASAISLGRT